MTTCGAGASINPAGAVALEKGTSPTFLIRPIGYDYTITDVLVDNVSQGVISSYTFTSISADHTIEVVTHASTIWNP
ncbi:MAG: hypothetical protein LLG06_01220 [Desulfobacteraceae bacterium]|nr:hypothetical protein [Desulfobacteraceae bacterium]